MSNVVSLKPAPRPFDVDATVEILAQRLEETAIERDRAGGHAAHERELIRASGLLDLSVPVEYGGQGRDWPTVFRAVRRLAQADAALAHVFGFHHLQLAGVLLYGSPDQRSRFLRDTVAQRLFWGNALNPVDKRLHATKLDGGFLLQGEKSFCSGSVGSDQLTVSAWHEPSASMLIGIVPTRREGVRVNADWDAFGQRQTDSGTVNFDDVLLAGYEVLQAPGAVPTPQATLRSQIAQLHLANLYVGIAQGAFEAALGCSREVSRPWFAAGVERSSDDPFIQHRCGELRLLLRPAQVLTDAAAVQLDAAFRRGPDLTALERGEVAIAVAEAKVLAHRAAVEISSQLFELTGARSTSQRFNAFQMNTVGHQSPGLWTHPHDQSHRYTDPDHWVELARLLERGLFDGVFLADVLGVYDVYRGTADAALRHGVQVPVNDPLALVPLMAQVTEHLGFGVTCALTYEHPYPFARLLSTLDHLTRGRIGWNIVTGYLESAARNLGLPRQLGHDDRYDVAEEYMEVVYKLWEHSWDDGAVLRDKARGIYTDPAKVHPIRHRGEHYQVPGFHLCEPSPQRTPVLYQAGTSPRGQTFAARHAECVFISGPSKAVVARSVSDLRSAAAQAGRDPHELLIYAQALVVTGATFAAADAKHARCREHIDLEAALALLSGWTGVDFSRYPPDATIEYIDTDAGRTALAAFSQADPSRRWTVGEAAQFIGLGGRGPVLVGDAPQVADQLEAWVDETGIDGFNLSFAVAHETIRDVAEHVVPELQRRGRYPLAYTPGTLRDKLFARGPRLGARHAGRQVRIDAAQPVEA